jgi:hypothetical protein
MKQKTLSLSTILGFLGILAMIHTFNSYAVTGAIECQTAFKEKIFLIEQGKISFLKEDDSGVSRSISSAGGDSVRTHTKQSGFSKTLYIDGNKHQINVLDTKDFSDANDYLSITSPKGHQMTYPLTCRSV